MTESSSHTPYRVIPPGELRCVWMTAGVLSYQLCDRNCNCDECPLDAAMRKHFVSSYKPAAVELKNPPSTELRKGYSYSMNHCWLCRQEDGTFRLGLEPVMTAALLIPKAVVLPVTGQKIKRGQVCAWIIMEDGTLPLAAPLDGEITTRNGTISDEPQEIFLEPFDRGWLFEIKADAAAPDSERLLTMKNAQRVFRDDSARFKDEVMSALDEQHPGMGRTMADGGMPFQNLPAVLGSKRYFSIVRKVFAKNFEKPGKAHRAKQERKQQ